MSDSKTRVIILVVAVVAVVSALPITISGLGLREASSVALLSYFGISEERALAFSLTFFAAFPVVKGLVGGITELIDLLRSFRGAASEHQAETVKPEEG